jgi:hypothetical protein
VRGNKNYVFSQEEIDAGLFYADPSGQEYTGDYDMHDMVVAKDGVKDPITGQTFAAGDRIPAESALDLKTRKQLNRELGYDPKIMHGCQADYGDFFIHERATGENEKLVGGLLKPDPPVTMFDGGTDPATVYRLNTTADLFNYYTCKGVPRSRHWNVPEAG